MAARLKDVAAPEGGLAALLPLLRELGDLKRLRSAGRTGSIASRLFREAWIGLSSGAKPDAVASRTTARALAATRLGDLDEAALLDLGMSQHDARAVQCAGLEAIDDVLDGRLVDALLSSLNAPAPTDGPVPAFVDALDAQPRAGVTCPGRARIVLQPPESHAEHCLAVAAYGVLLSQAYGAEPGTVFLAALAHHLHNAVMPDSGLTGEVLLGPHLDQVVRHATERALAELPAGLRETVERARAILPDAATPEGRAFHAADVIDRVLEIEQHLMAANLTMSTVLGDMELVHDGPVKGFHDGVLRRVGLLP